MKINVELTEDEVILLLCAFEFNDQLCCKCIMDNKCNDEDDGFSIAGGQLLAKLGIGYTKKTCPKSEDWFVRGGKCGWAHECEYCSEWSDKNDN